MRNSKLTIQKMQHTHVRSNERLVALDVESLYTNIDIKEGLQIMRVFLMKYKICDKNRINLILDLMSWVCKNNYFYVCGKFFRQVIGVAMGTPFAPSFANIFVAHYEKIWMEHHKFSFPKIYVRYLDDIFSIWKPLSAEKGNDDIADFIENVFNKRTPSLKFTYDIHDQEANFLDLTFSKGKRWRQTGTLDIKLYEKPTNFHLYTHPSSDYPYRYTHSWIHGENIRIMRNNTSRNQYDQDITAFRSFLITRGYDPLKVEEELSKTSYDQREHFVYCHSAPRALEGRTMVINHVPGWKNIKYCTIRLLRNLQRKEPDTTTYRQAVVGRGPSILHLAKQMYRKRTREEFDHPDLILQLQQDHPIANKVPQYNSYSTGKEQFSLINSMQNTRPCGASSGHPCDDPPPGGGGRSCNTSKHRPDEPPGEKGSL